MKLAELITEVKGGGNSWLKSKKMPADVLKIVTDVLKQHGWKPAEKFKKEHINSVNYFYTDIERIKPKAHEIVSNVSTCYVGNVEEDPNIDYEIDFIAIVEVSGKSREYSAIYTVKNGKATKNNKPRRKRK